MSASLARSRTLFGDKLLVRGPQGLVLTPRGEQILDRLNQIMEVTERLITLPAEFIPEFGHRTFTLMGSDFVEFVLLPSLMATLASEAPNLQILYKSPDRRNLEAMLANSELDLVVGYVPDPPKELIRRELFHEQFVCVARHGHPLLQDQGLKIEQYIELQHVQVLARDATVYGDDIERAIAAIGLVRKVALSRPSLPSGMWSLRRTSSVRFPVASLLISLRCSPSWCTTRLWRSLHPTSHCIGTRAARKTPGTSGSEIRLRY